MQSDLPPGLRRLYPFQGHFLEIDGQRIHYLDEGEGPVVVMVHGNPTWSFFYRDLIRDLSRDHRCIAIDHLGCGLSDKPVDAAYGLELHIANLVRLMEYLGLETYDLVVHDWGGPIGLGASSRTPARLGRTVIMNTAAFPSPWFPLRIRVCRTPGIGPFMIRGLNGFSRAALTMAVNRRPLSADARVGFLYPYANWADRVAVNAFVQDIPSREDHPSYPLLVEIEQSLSNLDPARVLLAWGGADFCFHTGFLKRWQAILPGAETLLVKDAGHYLLEDAGAEVIPAVRRFLMEDCRREM